MVNREHGLKVCVLTSPVMGQIDIRCSLIQCMEKGHHHFCGMLANNAQPESNQGAQRRGLNLVAFKNAKVTQHVMLDGV